MVYNHFIILSHGLIIDRGIGHFCCFAPRPQNCISCVSIKEKMFPIDFAEAELFLFSKPKKAYLNLFLTSPALPKF